MEGDQSHRCRSRLQDSGSTIAGREFGRGYFHPALHPCGMFDKIDVDGGSCEQAAREHGDEFRNLTHESPLSERSIEQAAISRCPLCPD
jgi:hypothetical protein